MVFYPASAWRRSATHKDIIPGKTFETYAEAKAFVLNYGHDSDDVVFIQINGEWALAWGYNDSGELLVCAEDAMWSNAIPISKFIQRQTNKKGEDNQ